MSLIEPMPPIDSRCQKAAAKSPITRVKAWIRSKYYSVGDFGRNVLVVLTGAVGAQLIYFGAAPLLSRLYKPEDFGMAGSFQAMALLLMGVASGRYDLAITLPDVESQAKKVVHICMVASLVSAALVVALGWVAFPVLLRFSIFNELRLYLIYIPLLMVVGGVGSALTGWCNRKREFLLLARIGYIRSFATAAAGLIIGTVSSGAGGLVAAFIVGNAISVICLWLSVRHSCADGTIGDDINEYKLLARRYSNFPKYSVFSGLVETGAIQLPTLALGSMYSMQVAGYYSFANRLVSVPFSLLAKSFGDVFRQAASESYLRNGKCDMLYLKTSASLTRLSLTVAILLCAFAPWSFAFLFGVEWREAGIYTSILSLMFGARLIASPLGVMIYIAERQVWDLAIQVTLLAAILGGLAFAAYNDWPARAAIGMFGAIYTAKYAIEYLLAYKLSRCRSIN